jgi:hypothetical protein
MDIMAEIREGMHVVDADGKDVGKVTEFSAGDPESVTVGEGRRVPDGSFVGSVGILMDADLTEEEAERLSHSGWVRIHKGLFTHDRFLPADELDRIEDDRLLLKPGVHLK